MSESSYPHPSDRRPPAERVRVIPGPAVTVVELNLPEVLDSAEFDRLNDAVRSAVDADAARGWVLDLSGVTYMGSAVLGFLVNVRQRVRDGGGRLVLCGVSPRLGQTLRACSLERLLVVEPTRDAAVARAKR